MKEHKLRENKLREKREAIEAEAWDSLVKDLNGNNGGATSSGADSGAGAGAGTDTNSDQPRPPHEAGDPKATWNSAKHIVKQAFSLRDDVAEYDVIERRIYDGGRITGTNLSILFFAILIASIGLNMNSTAVIIGAMLISPLMGTIQSMGFSIATVDMFRFRRAFLGFTFQVLTALGTSTLYFLISPVKTTTSELLGRTSPSVWDILIATAGGLAGIIAITRKDANSNVVPGVAIATALMPPLCTCGYALANAHWRMLLGAGLLFTINTMFIMLSAVIILVILEVPEVASATPQTRKRMRLNLFRNTAIVLVITIAMTTFVFLRSDPVDSADASPITSEMVSTAAITEEMRILFPEVDEVQIGQMEEMGKDGKVQKVNTVLLTLNEPLTEERKDTLNRWVDAAYDEDYTIIYQNADTTDIQNTKDIPNGTTEKD